MPAGRKAAALEPSPASAWGDEPDQKEHVLPTERVMTLRRGLSMRRLVMQGVIPSAIIGITASPPDENGERTYIVDQKLYEEQRAAIVCAMVVEPPVVMAPIEGTGGYVLYDLLEDSEVDYILAHATQGVAGTARFLVDAVGDADGPSGEAVGEVAE